MNLGAGRCHPPDFVARVARTIQDIGANPVRLKLALTESIVLESAEMAAGRVGERIEQELNFYLDDAGTGYSSLSCPKLPPLSQLNRDRTLVQNLMTARTLRPSWVQSAP